MDSAFAFLLVLAPLAFLLQGCTSSFDAETDKVFSAWAAHQKAFYTCDVKATVDTYAEDAVLSFVNQFSGKHEVFGQGSDFVKSTFTTLYDRLRNVETGFTTAQFIDNTSMNGPTKGINVLGNVVFLQWKAPEADGYAYQWGADNFVYNKNMKIAVHTIFFSGGPPSIVDPVTPVIVGRTDKSYYDAWNVHAQAFSSCNATAIADTYAIDAVLSFVNHVTGKQETFGQGPIFVHDAFVKLFERMCDPQTGKNNGKLIDGSGKAESDGSFWSLIGGGTQKDASPFQEGVNILGNVAFVQWKTPQTNGYTYHWASNTVAYNTALKITIHTIYFKGEGLTQLLTE